MKGLHVAAVAAVFVLALAWTTAASAVPVELPAPGSADETTTEPQPTPGEGEATDEGSSPASDEPGDEVTTTGDDESGDESEADAQANEAAAGDDEVAAAGDDRDCPDFATQGDAQNYFDENSGSSSNNVDRLDADNDGIACENLSSDSAPAGGIDTGGGGTAPPNDRGASAGPIPFVLAGAALGLLFTLLGSSLRRRVTA